MSERSALLVPLYLVALTRHMAGAGLGAFGIVPAIVPLQYFEIRIGGKGDYD